MIVDDIKNNLKIVNLAESEGLEVRKQGKTYVSKCCFHTETNSSLTFYPKTNTFHCFGCQKSGDVINFYAALKNLSLKKSIESLKTRSNSPRLDVKNTCTIDSKAKKKSTKAILARNTPHLLDDTAKDRIYRALKDFCGPLNQEALDYLTGPKRGLTSEVLTKHGVFSINDYQKTKAFLLANFSLEDLEAASLVNNGRYMFNQHRIIIPIEVEKKIIALHFRYFFKGESFQGYQPKFKITKGLENRLFNQDSLLTLAKGSKVFLCEGEFDTMVLLQSGENAVGIASPSFCNDKTMRFLNDFYLIIAFDNDKNGTGQKMTVKMQELFFNQTGRKAKRLDYEDMCLRAGREVKDVTEYYLAINNMQFVV